MQVSNSLPQRREGAEEKIVRNISEILIESDSVKQLNPLIDLWNEIANNKYKYTLVEIRFANEHIRELSLKVEGPDIRKGEFYLALKEMYLNS